jgi:hypothetical protein
LSFFLYCFSRTNTEASPQIFHLKTGAALWSCTAFPVFLRRNDMVSVTCQAGARDPFGDGQKKDGAEKSSPYAARGNNGKRTAQAVQSLPGSVSGFVPQPSLRLPQS